MGRIERMGRMGSEECGSEIWDLRSQTLVNNTRTGGKAESGKAETPEKRNRSKLRGTKGDWVRVRGVLSF